MRRKTCVPGYIPGSAAARYVAQQSRGSAASLSPAWCRGSCACRGGAIRRHEGAHARRNPCASSGVRSRRSRERASPHLAGRRPFPPSVAGAPPPLAMSDEGAGAFLARLTAKLAAAGVPNMVVGSFASSFHGVPRSSQDLDLEIDPQPESLRRFLSDLPPVQRHRPGDGLEGRPHRADFEARMGTAGWQQPAPVERRFGDLAATR